jgi:hypothetical protein
MYFNQDFRNKKEFHMQLIRDVLDRCYENEFISKKEIVEWAKPGLGKGYVNLEDIDYIFNLLRNEGLIGKHGKEDKWWSTAKGRIFYLMRYWNYQ